MQDKEFLAQLMVNIADIWILIRCEEPVIRYPYERPFIDPICEKHRPDIIFNIHLKHPMSTPKCKEKIVYHNWCLSRIGNRLFRQSFNGNLLYYSVFIDYENGICDFHFEETETILREGLDISVFNQDYPFMLYMQPQFEGILLHASAVNYRGKSLVFSGTSGTGKSTLIELWRSQRVARILGDDRIIIRKKGDSFLVYSVPWKKQTIESGHKSIELYKIFFPRHDLKNIATRKTRVEASALILNQSFHTFWDKPMLEQTLKFIDEMINVIPCFDLGFVPDATVIEYLDSLEVV